MIFYKPQLICQIELDKDGKYFYTLNFQKHLPIAEIIYNSIAYDEILYDVSVQVFKKLGLHII